MRQWAKYNGCLIVGANQEGLYLSILLPFRIGHSPLFIPWKDVSMTETQTLFSRGIAMSFACCPSIPLTMSKSLFQKISDASGGIHSISGHDG
jgi:hypothetical protein